MQKFYAVDLGVIILKLCMKLMALTLLLLCFSVLPQSHKKPMQKRAKRTDETYVSVFFHKTNLKLIGYWRRFFSIMINEMAMICKKNDIIKKAMQKWFSMERMIQIQMDLSY